MTEVLLKKMINQKTCVFKPKQSLGYIRKNGAKAPFFESMRKSL